MPAFFPSDSFASYTCPPHQSFTVPRFKLIAPKLVCIYVPFAGTESKPFVLWYLTSHPVPCFISSLFLIGFPPVQPYIRLETLFKASLR